MINSLQRVLLPASLAAIVVGCSSSKTPAGSPAAPSDAGDQGSGGLCDRLGGPPGIGTKVGDIVTAFAMDPSLAPFFANNVPTPQPGHPSGNEIVECVTLQLASAASCPGVRYPATTRSGFTCRDMKTSHRGLGIDRATFTKFVAISGAELARDGVTAPDVATVVAFFNSTQADIVDPATRTP